MKAIDTYRLDKKIKLATYASRCIENEILMYIRKTAREKSEVSLDEPINMDGDGNELLLSDIPSGKYYFTVYSQGDYKNTRDSETVTSPEVMEYSYSMLT